MTRARNNAVNPSRNVAPTRLNTRSQTSPAPWNDVPQSNLIVRFVNVTYMATIHTTRIRAPFQCAFMNLPMATVAAAAAPIAMIGSALCNENSDGRT